MKTWKGFTILDATNFHDSQEEVIIGVQFIKRSLEEIDSTLMDDFEDFMTSVEKVTAGAVEIVRELQLEVKSGNMTELLLSNEKIFGRCTVAS